MANSSDPEEQQLIIADLCASAPTTTIRDCLRKYDPLKTSWQIENSLKSEKKGVLVETLEYLGLANMNEYKSAALPHELVCRIQNLFPDTCDLCKQSYCVKLGEKPIISCVRCGQGCHNQCILQLIGKSDGELTESNQFGSDIVNPYATIGLFYICSPCQREVIPNKGDLKTKQSKKSNPPDEEIVSIPAGNDRTGVIRRDSNVSTISNEHPVHAEQNSSETSGNVTNRANRTIHRSPEDSGPNQDESPRLCKFYRMGRCKHGISGKKDGVCKYNHPKPCKKLLTNGTNRRWGCTKGENCNLFHPQMCYRSMKERVCLREGCSFMHVKGTNRTEHVPENNQNRSQDPPRLMDLPRQQNLHSSGKSSSSQDRFFEHIKAMEDQLAKAITKIQQLDQNYSQLSQQLPTNHLKSCPQPVQSLPNHPLVQSHPLYYNPYQTQLGPVPVPSLRQ